MRSLHSLYPLIPPPAHPSHTHTHTISKKKTLTNYTSTSRFIIICQIHDILGKYLETRKQSQTKLRVCKFHHHSLKNQNYLQSTSDRQTDRWTDSCAYRFRSLRLFFKKDPFKFFISSANLRLTYIID